MKNLDKMFMNIAELTAQQSNCVKYKVGCVIVKDKRVILQGYNGTFSGFINCNEKFDEDNFEGDSHHLWSSAVEIHAEMNCISYAARKGISLENTIMFCTHKPCNNCLKHIISCGVSRVVYLHDYIDKNQQDDVKLFKNFIDIIKF